jgi:LysM repeat protein
MKYFIVSVSLLLSVGCSHKQLAYVDIKSGDTLSELASRYKVSQKKLRVLNPSIKNPDLIFRGKKLVLRKK